MNNSRSTLESPPKQEGCLKAAAGFAALVLLAPAALIVRSIRAWKRGKDLRTSFEETPITNAGGQVLRRLDLKLDVPPAAEIGFHSRLVSMVVRVAEALRQPDDIYHLAYRIPWDVEPVVLPVGPLLQELGDRFSLVLSQGALAMRTVIWLTLGRDRALAEVVDPYQYDPEAEGEPEALFARADARWAMASSWARVGPSLVVRLVLFVPEKQAARVRALLEKIY